jgi:hypothetical protein
MEWFVKFIFSLYNHWLEKLFKLFPAVLNTYFTPVNPVANAVA